MIDYAKISVKAGDGGWGSGSMMKIRGRRYPKADGGDGGNGGSVYFEGTFDLNTLAPFRFIKKYEAKGGQAGLSKKRRGADGGDLVIKVPVGTVIRSLGNWAIGSLGKQEEPKNLTTQQPNSPIFDLTEDGQKVLAARGGGGGRGNVHLRDEFGRRPRSGEEGSAGEILNLTLELKLIADIGIIGRPNAGKSTLLAALTSAKPKIAPYPFTTLEPNLGVVDTRLLGRWAIGLLGQKTQKPKNLKTEEPFRQLVLADIPGLIEGASQGRGLGDLFLRHIERTRILVHLIDMSQGDAWKDYQSVRGELKAYSKQLSKKREIIVLNKIDLVSQDVASRLEALFRAKKKKVVAISAEARKGFDKLGAAILKSL